jgi:predicted homoserine dehydrogenase-like protein
MRVARRGMHGPTVEPGTPVEDAAKAFDPDELLDGPGIVDYVVGASPGPGVFVLGTHDNPVQRHYLELYKLGEGPLYCFTTPYHLCHFEVPATVARAVLFGDAALAPLDGIRVEVVAAAKVDLSPGDELDGPGGYLTYGLAENAAVTEAERLLPMGLAEGCSVTRPIAQDAVLTYEDIAVPPGRFVDGLRAEQNAAFPVAG